MLNKEECEIALENAVDAGVITKDWKILNQLIEEHFDKNGNVKVLANIVIDEDKMKEIIDEEIKKLIVPEPYKFEELKPNMWVWDNVAKECLYVVRPFVGSFTGVKYFTCLGIYKNLEEIRKLDIKFEENRFLPVQCANLEIEN
ncbi:MAG: hypothetical protein PHV15_07190 [Thomasclavelia ramosa]|nr:hypothetical protein [Thomasclavelia ramosa]